MTAPHALSLRVAWQDEVVGLTERIEEGMAALGIWRRPVESLQAMVVPDARHVQSLIDQNRADTAEDKAHGDALAASTQEVTRLELDLQQFVRNFQPVSRDQVVHARQLRDGTWHEIKLAPDGLLERAAPFEGYVTDADKLADDRLDRAQFEADRQSKTDALEHKQRERHDLESRLQAIQSRMGERVVQWDALTSTCGLPQLPLELAPVWIQQRQLVLDLVAERAAAERRCSAQHAAAQALRDTLLKLLGTPMADDSPAPDLSMCLRQAGAQLKLADQAQGQRKTLEQQIHEGQSSMAKLQASVLSAHESWDAWGQSWQLALQAACYGADVSAEQVEAELAVMLDIERLLDRIRGIRSERIETMQADLNGMPLAKEVLGAELNVVCL